MYYLSFLITTGKPGGVKRFKNLLSRIIKDSSPDKSGVRMTNDQLLNHYFILITIRLRFDIVPKIFFNRIFAAVAST